MRNCVFLFFLSGNVFSQNIIWENIQDCEPWEIDVWRSIEYIQNDKFLVSGTCGNNYIGTFQWIDFQGNTLQFIKDSVNQVQWENSDLGLDRLGNIFTCGNALIGGYVAKFSNNGSLIWDVPLNLPNGISNTESLLVLNDGSVVVSGMRLVDQTTFFGDIFYYHIDSTGNILGEGNFSQIAGTETAYDILEMHDGSFLFIGRGSTINDERPFYVRTDSKFNPLSSGYISVPGVDFVRITKANLNVDKGVVLSGQEYTNSINPKNFAIWLDSSLITTHDTSIGAGLLYVKTMQDSSFLGYGTDFSLESFLCRFSKEKNFVSKSVYGTDGRALNDVAFDTLGRLVGVGGIPDTATSSYSFYTVGFDSVGFEFVPDYCAWSPPKADFSWSYAYPILTLYDSCFSGLVHRDSIYGFQWSSSFGDTGSQQQFQVFYDSAGGGSIDVSLIITNWHGCRDTVTRIFDATVLQSLDENLAHPDLRIVPNPASGSFSLSISGTDRINLRRVSIQGLEGKQRMDFHPLSTEEVFDISGLPAGTYLVRVELEGRTLTQKLIKY